MQYVVRLSSCGDRQPGCGVRQAFDRTANLRFAREIEFRVSVDSRSEHSAASAMDVVVYVLTRGKSAAA